MAETILQGRGYGTIRKYNSNGGVERLAASQIPANHEEESNSRTIRNGHVFGGEWRRSLPREVVITQGGITYYIPIWLESKARLKYHLSRGGSGWRRRCRFISG
ncbi:hypothetical protein H5410_061004 [Solanum commersonii]|uniref:Uncharacterized protein n=1 Tax=Solanum commersonii TaxID=4109 RepID=A0A9J5W892_SOLCO|nr:hypothetical protein H5410_061004 [Solanum commersonii]